MNTLRPSRLATILCVGLLAAVLAGCPGPAASDGNRESATGDGSGAPSGAETRKENNGSLEPNEDKPAAPPDGDKSAADKACRDLDVGEMKVVKSQTFAFDHKPFEGSCFVTVRDPEYDDPPLGSKIAIYKDGKSVFGFPDSVFGRGTGPCWVEAVSFRDLTGDGSTDIVVVGKCGAKSGDIQTNEVHMNNGRDFSTSVRANDRLEEFTTVKDIAEFVSKNKQLFTP